MDSLKAIIDLWRWQALLEIPLIAIVAYFVMRLIEGTRVAGTIKVLVVFFIVGVVFVTFAGPELGLNVTVWLVERSLPILAVSLIFIFQPELRRGLIMLGRTPFFSFLTHGESASANEIFDAVIALAKKRIGALIAIQREVGMRGYIERCVRIDAEVTKELIMSIFHPGTPLHDGAVVVRNNRIAGAGCLLPLSENIDVGVGMGTRHRAGVGVTEETDAICIIVSEETGAISIAMNGKIERNVDRERLRSTLREFYIERTAALDTAKEQA